MPRLVIYPEQEAFNDYAALRIAKLAYATLQVNEHFCLALAGGSTPKPIYELLAQASFKDQLDWSRIHLFFGDERAVAPDDAESNYRMVQEALIGRIPIPVANVHRIKGELAPERAASQYEAELSAFFEGVEGTFDLVLLGLGDDGHTASLFPHSPILQHSEGRMVRENFVAEMNSWRISLTASVINEADNIMFLVAGAGKAGAVQAVLEGAYQPELYPAQLIRRDETVTWVLDEAAAALLTRDDAS
ncbi:6-phosphogluconolactonase [Anaerolineales bacterium]